MTPAGRVLLVFSRYSSFVRRDHEILARRYEVETFRLDWHPGLKARLKGTHLELLRAIRRNDVVYWWFLADYVGLGAVYARLLGRPFIGVAGGYDVVCAPELGYGRLAVGSWRDRLATKTALRLAQTVLTVSPANDEETRQAGRSRGRLLVPLGLDPERWVPGPGTPHDARPQVVAVGAIDATNLEIKGQRIFADLSRAVPEADFLMVGEAEDVAAQELRQRGALNLHILGPVANERLPALLQSADVVCQLSRRESFGMALVEAVACGCVPVYTADAVGAGHYLGGLGYAVPFGDVDAAARAVRRAVVDARKPGTREQAHAVVRGTLRTDLRAERLHALVDGLLRS